MLDVSQVMSLIAHKIKLIYSAAVYQFDRKSRPATNHFSTWPTFSNIKLNKTTKLHVFILRKKHQTIERSYKLEEHKPGRVRKKRCRSRRGKKKLAEGVVKGKQRVVWLMWRWKGSLMHSGLSSTGTQRCLKRFYSHLKNTPRHKNANNNLSFLSCLDTEREGEIPYIQCTPNSKCFRNATSFSEPGPREQLWRLRFCPGSRQRSREIFCNCEMKTWSKVASVIQHLDHISCSSSAPHSVNFKGFCSFCQNVLVASRGLCSALYLLYI